MQMAGESQPQVADLPTCVSRPLAPVPVPSVMPCNDVPVLERNTKAWYSSASGERALVQIVNVHFDDEQPYYTIHLDGGVERSTVRSRLVPVTAEEERSRAAAAKAKACAETAAAAAKVRTQEDALRDAVAMLSQGVPSENVHPEAMRRQTRPPSPGRRQPKVKAPASPWRDEKAAQQGGCCMICRGKRKSIYRACEECKRGMKAIGGDLAPSGAMSSVFAVGVSAIVGESIGRGAKSTRLQVSAAQIERDRRKTTVSFCVRKHPGWEHVGRA